MTIGQLISSHTSMLSFSLIITFVSKDVHVSKRVLDELAHLGGSGIVPKTSPRTKLQ